MELWKNRKSGSTYTITKEFNINQQSDKNTEIDSLQYQEICIMEKLEY